MQDDHQLSYAQDIVNLAQNVSNIGAPKSRDPGTMPPGATDLTSMGVKAALDGGHDLDFDIILFRPFMEYELSSAILTKGGYDTGATFARHFADCWIF